MGEDSALLLAQQMPLQMEVGECGLADPLWVPVVDQQLPAVWSIHSVRVRSHPNGPDSSLLLNDSVFHGHGKAISVLTPQWDRVAFIERGCQQLSGCAGPNDLRHRLGNAGKRLAEIVVERRYDLVRRSTGQREGAWLRSRPAAYRRCPDTRQHPSDE